MSARSTAVWTLVQHTRHQKKVSVGFQAIREISRIQTELAKDGESWDVRTTQCRPEDDITVYCSGQVSGGEPRVDCPAPLRIYRENGATKIEETSRGLQAADPLRDSYLQLGEPYLREPGTGVARGRHPARDSPLQL